MTYLLDEEGDGPEHYATYIELLVQAVADYPVPPKTQISRRYHIHPHVNVLTKHVYKMPGRGRDRDDERAADLRQLRPV